MIDNLFEWYYQNTDALKLTANDVIENGEFYSAGFYGIDTYIFEGLNFYLKKPHSARFKELDCFNTIKNQKISRDLAVFDNELCTMSELVSEKKYRAHKFLAAKHFSMPVGREFLIMSPNMFCEEVEATDIDGIDKNAEFYEPSKINLSKTAKQFATGTSKYNLRQILKNKERFLQFMTEHCYEQFVNYFLLSAFELTDDENNNNLMFAKQKESDRLEEVFVFDKESTVFNFLLAQGENFDSIKQRLLDLNEFCDVVLGGKNISARCKTLKNLFYAGLLNENHKELLTKSLAVDYDKLSDEVSLETGLKKHQSQIDLYKFGQDLTDKFLREL